MAASLRGREEPAPLEAASKQRSKYRDWEH
jgi:hypothetical protein